MVLNGYTILCVFLSLLRLLSGVVVVVVSVAAWRSFRRTTESESSETIENRSYLLLLTGIVLIGLNVVSWPILYLLLQSYVKEWPAVMCIYGVTKIGAGTFGASGLLPILILALQWIKPLLIFVSGAGFILYMINRQTRTAPILINVLLTLMLTGVVSTVDAVVELSWLTISKTETRLAGGCCTNALENLRKTEKFTPAAQMLDRNRIYLMWAYYSLNLALILALFVRVRLWPNQLTGKWMWSLLTCSLLSIPVNLLFLTEIAAPTILGLPFHHCPYDLITAAPESIFAVILFLLGCFSLGWSMVAVRFGRSDETVGFLQIFVSKLQFVALFGYSGSVVMITSELLVA